MHLLSLGFGQAARKPSPSFLLFAALAISLTGCMQLQIVGGGSSSSTSPVSTPPVPWNLGYGYTGLNLGGASVSGPSDSAKVDWWGGIAEDQEGRFIGLSYNSNDIGGSENVLVRFNKDGTLDTTFGPGFTGYVIFNHDGADAAGKTPGSDWGQPFVDSEDRYVVIGQSTSASGGYPLVIWRYLNDGTLDTSFGGTGYIVYTNAGADFAGAATPNEWSSPLMEDSGKYVFSIQGVNASGGKDIGIMRVNASDGSLDLSLNGTGYNFPFDNAVSPTGVSAASKTDAFSDLSTVMLDPTQTYYYVAAYLPNTSGGWEILLYRYLRSNGSLDVGFGSGGYVIYNLNGTGIAGASAAAKQDWPENAVMDSQGNVVLAGSANMSGGGNLMFLLRFKPDGTVDAGFNGTGVLTYLGSGSTGLAGATGASINDSGSAQIDSEGKIVVTGFSKNSSGGEELAIWKYNPDGTPDTSFGSGWGAVLFDHNEPGLFGEANGSKTQGQFWEVWMIDSNGRYIIPGEEKNSLGGEESPIWGYYPDGTLASVE